MRYTCIHAFDSNSSYVWHNLFIRVIWLTDMCDMTHSHVWHDSSTRVIWLIHVCDMTHRHVWHNSITCVAWLIHMCDMTHPHVWYDSSTCVARLTDMCDMTHSHVWHDSFMCVTWLIHTCDMTHPRVWYDSFTCVTWLIHMCDMTHMFRAIMWLHHTHTHTHPKSHSHTLTHIVGGVTWLLHVCGMTHWLIRVTRFTHSKTPYDIIFSCVTWILHICHISHLCVWHDSQISSQYLTSFSNFLMCTMTVSYVWLDSFICVTWLRNCEQTRNSIAFSDMSHGFFIYKAWLIYMLDMTHRFCAKIWQHFEMSYVTSFYVGHDSHICVTWLTYSVPKYISIFEYVTWLLLVWALTHI